MLKLKSIKKKKKINKDEGFYLYCKKFRHYKELHGEALYPTGEKLVEQ
jgi:hypothetical protein